MGPCSGGGPSASGVGELGGDAADGETRGDPQGRDPVTVNGYTICSGYWALRVTWIPGATARGTAPHSLVTRFSEPRYRSAVATTAPTPPSPAPPATDRRTAKREATRARLYEETVREFGARGFAATEISVITDRVGLSRGAFYVHFTGKDEVLRELLSAEERLIADAALASVGAEAAIRDLFLSVVDTVFAAEERIGRQLVRDLCAAQFRHEFVQLLSVEDHPLGLMLVAEIARRAPDADPVDLTMVFLTGLFGLLATDEASITDRRRRTDLLVDLVTGSLDHWRK